ncbi:hypothetical protein GGX14DRAFT_394333 [Mycena pura]|uniref:Uncharacterized protein n=1 Tax=Mycena pura TaxID=153505 RepID=A0AAD6YE13_9AGAR|nr:hypothetical protein GGX14DRAFT_408049 [Mycena pura]KAJ7211422.1 hypothetical protein GGX14DRAFT_394333 [Mycena pura]
MPSPRSCQLVIENFKYNGVCLGNPDVIGDSDSVTHAGGRRQASLALSCATALADDGYLVELSGRGGRHEHWHGTQARDTSQQGVGKGQPAVDETQYKPLATWQGVASSGETCGGRRAAGGGRIAGGETLCCGLRGLRFDRRVTLVTDVTRWGVFLYQMPQTL